MLHVIPEQLMVGNTFVSAPLPGQDQFVGWNETTRTGIVIHGEANSLGWSNGFTCTVWRDGLIVDRRYAWNYTEATQYANLGETLQ
jgi:hypothetical protein